MSGQKCPMGCLGHGGAGVCPHCGDWHQDDDNGQAGRTVTLQFHGHHSRCVEITHRYGRQESA